MHILIFICIFAAKSVYIPNIMTPEQNSLEQSINSNQSDCIVLRDVDHLPMQGQEFVAKSLVLCINQSGTARLLYDLREVTFRSNNVACVMPNHIVQSLETSPDFRVTLIILSEKFVEDLKQRILTHDYRKFHLEPDTYLTTAQAEQVNKWVDLLQTTCELSLEEMPHRHDVLLALVCAAYEFLNVCRRPQDTNLQQTMRNTDLFNQFCNLLAQHYRQSREVNFYAAKLHLTPKYFSKIIFEAIGVTAGRWIDDFVAIKAKQILATRPGLSVQEVSIMLGFSEEAGFCRFFKRVTGMTPKEYRRSQFNG